MRAHTVTGGDGVQLYVEETGNPNGRPVLFIHGFSQCRLAWQKQMTSDLADDFRLVALDIRGHGQSQKPYDAYGESQSWADDIEAVLLDLDLDRPVLCGWSYGGVIICDYLQAYGEESIAGINLVGAVTQLGAAARAVTGSDFRALMPGLFASDVAEAIPALQQFLRLCVYADPTPEDAAFFLGYNVMVPPYVRLGLFNRTLSHAPLLPRLRKPVLITHGQEDAIVLPAAAEQHAAAITHAQLSLYPQVGHAPFWEDPARFNRELRAFVAAS